jgi:hypothetical protein
VSGGVKGAVERSLAIMLGEGFARAQESQA